MTDTLRLEECCAGLVSAQRIRAEAIKFRVMIENRLTAIVAGGTGYHAGDGEAERKKSFDAARKLVAEICDHIRAERFAHPEGPWAAHGHRCAWAVEKAFPSIDGFREVQKESEKNMLPLARHLPVAEWIHGPELRGIGLLQVAIVVGECGNLSNYANPGKLWRRMGCAPWTHGEHTLMGSTWRAGKVAKLTAEGWESFGYCPRRRSIAYLIGEGIVKQNADVTQEGKPPLAYKRVYVAAKERAKEVHPDWTPKHAHMHAMLLATKAFLMDLWRVWHGKEPRYGAKPTEAERAEELRELDDLDRRKAA